VTYVFSALVKSLLLLLTFLWRVGSSKFQCGAG